MIADNSMRAEKLVARPILQTYKLTWSSGVGNGNNTEVVKAVSQEAATAMALDRLRNNGVGWGYYIADLLVPDGETV